MVNLNAFIKGFGSNSEIIPLLFSGLSSEEVYWKPAPDRWSLLEVICHLRDEEKEDFRPRLMNLLEGSNTELWPEITPETWVNERNYQAQNFKLVLSDFLTERNKSILWLNSLESPNWDSIHKHPTLGTVSASYILANWLAHDHLHIRQITRLKYDYLRHLSGVDLSYAGKW